MEKTTIQIDLTRKKRLGEILGEAYGLLTAHFKLLAKLSVIGLVPGVLLQYLLFMSPSFGHYLLYPATDTPFRSLTGFECFLPLFVGYLFVQIYLNTVPYAFFRHYKECRKEGNTLTFTDTLVPFLKLDIPRALLLTLVLAIPVILTFPIGFYSYILVFMVTVSFMVERTSLGKAVKEGCALGTRYWARSFVGGLVVLFVSGILVVIFAMPYVVLCDARMSAYLSGLEGNEVDLPWYFNAMMLLTGMIFLFVGQLCNLFATFAVTLHFYNLKARRAEKLQAVQIPS